MIGFNIRLDRAVNIELLHHILDTSQEYLDIATSLEKRKRITDMGLLVSGRGGSAGLKVNELLNLSLKGVLEHDQEAENLEYVILPLLRQFKGETRLSYYLIPVAAATQSGINNRFWMNAFLYTRRAMRETR